MVPLLIFLLSLYHLQLTTLSELVDSQSFNSNNLLPNNNANELNTLLEPTESNDVLFEHNDAIPFIRTGHDQTEVEFRDPISSVNIDYSKNVIVLKFRKDHSKLNNVLNPASSEDQRNSMESNFMRFGRSSGDFMRFGKRQYEEMPTGNRMGADSVYYAKVPVLRNERSDGLRDSRGDNFMRFGRAPSDFMRFGRAPADFMRFGRNPADFMRFGRAPADFMRFGRSRTDKDDFMRFGRSPHDTIDSSGNFMRFGKRFDAKQQKNDNQLQAKTIEQKNDIHEAAKIFHASNKGTGDEGNPMDKAIQVLYNKHQQQQEQHRDREQQTNKSEEDAPNLNETELNANFDMI